MLDIVSVRLFILAVEFGNLTRAAEAAGTVQRVVTARIKQLEAAVGRKLLERTPRFVRPTADGVAFLAKARALMAAHDDAIRFDSTPVTRFAMGASDHALGTGLEHVIRHVRAALPSGSAIELRIGMSQHVRAAFDDGELEAVIVRREAAGRRARCSAPGSVSIRASEYSLRWDTAIAQSRSFQDGQDGYSAAEEL